MADGGGLELVGPDLSAGLGRLGRAAADQADAERAAAELVRDAVRRRVPRRTGNLASSIGTTAGGQVATTARQFHPS